MRKYDINTEKSTAPPSARTQRDRILQLLIEGRGGWIGLPKIAACAAQYNSRILELRRLGFAIENRSETRAGQRHSWFRLCQNASVPKPETASQINHTEAPPSQSLFSNLPPERHRDDG